MEEVMIEEGQTAPDFSLPDSQGKTVSLKDLRGKKVVLYFYPKDDTPGCTIEACEFRDHHKMIEDLNAVVLGVSTDSPESHIKFVEKFNLPFILLCDRDASVARSYGVKPIIEILGKTLVGVHRTTFIIDEAGKIIKVFRKVVPTGHSEEVLALLRQK